MKAQQIKENPHASVVFFWEPLYRQVRIEGAVQTLPPEAVEPYYAGLPREQRLSLLLGKEDQPVSSRDELLRMKAELRAKYPGDTPLPTPPHLVAYQLVPDKFIFYHGDKDWLPDRFEYTKQPDNSWVVQRLMP